MCFRQGRIPPPRDTRQTPVGADALRSVFGLTLHLFRLPVTHVTVAA